MEKPIVSVAGLRGIVGQTFTPEILVSYVAAFADMLSKKKVVVGGDSRPSREWAQPVVESILRARGVEVVSIGLAPTPTVGMMVRHFKAGGGIAITASHNPIEWNGLKFFHAGGEFLTPAHHHKIVELMKTPAAPKGGVRIGRFTRSDEALSTHLDTLNAVAGKYIPKRRRRIRLVLDCCNGAGSTLGPLVAAAFGSTAEIIFNNPGRTFPRGAEPLPENLRALTREVAHMGADFGAAMDPDADRLALVDETGRPIGEERTFLLAADAWLSLTGEKTPLVVNLSTSQAVDHLAAKYRTTVARSKIGEAHVLAMMKKIGATLGGEGNGGVILPAVHPGRDAATALALVLLGLHLHPRRTLSQWNAEFPDFVMVKTKVEVGDLSLKTTMRRARSIFKNAIGIDETDGIKFLFPNSFLHLRPSGTEPIVRIFVEAPDKTTAQQLLAQMQAVLK
ncbi:MAG: phosphoglucosamine mutase [Candidatus Sumerlaeia bacterium]|nr:phosphoglucosamine mutase [Candidatus Sumerlaeia bacterium]